MVELMFVFMAVISRSIAIATVMMTSVSLIAYPKNLM